MTEKRWRAVFAAFVTMAHSPGVHYCYGIFQAELVASRALGTSSRALIGGAGSLSTCLMELGAYGSGVLQDRFGARNTVMAGGILAVLGLAGAGLSTQVWHMYASYGVAVGLGHSLTFPPCPVAVASFFDGHPRASLASGIATAGSGAGTALFAIVADVVVEAYDWRVAFFVIAASSLLFIESTAPALGREASTSRPSIRLEAPLSKPLAKLIACASVYSIGWEIPFVHAVSYGRDAGYSRSQAAGIVVFIGVGGAFGRIAFLAAADRVGPPSTLVCACALTALFDATLPVLIDRHIVALYLYALVVGSTAGACIGLTTPLAKACRPPEISVSKASGLVYTAMAPGLLVGPIVAGAIRDETSDFDLAFYAAAIAWFVAFVLALFLKRDLRHFSNCSRNTRSPTDSSLEVEIPSLSSKASIVTCSSASFPHRSHIRVKFAERFSPVCRLPRAQSSRILASCSPGASEEEGCSSSSSDLCM